jgi:CheY-like chemotaxis protein
MTGVPQSQTSTSVSSSGPARQSTILVIDDREQNRKLLRMLFESHYRVIGIDNGPEGLAVAERERPDCILLDLQMPGMSGFEVLERLQDDPRMREIPVIILTATDDNPKNLERAMWGGAVDYLTKPFSPLRVRSLVRAAIERRRLLTKLQDLRAAFTSMLVHDLRSPLTDIQGYAQRLATGSPNEEHREGLREIQGSCDRMLHLIGEILDLSKLEAGRLAIEPRSVDLPSLLAD